MTRLHSIRSLLATLLVSLLFMGNLSGCALLSMALQSVPDVEPAKYKNLAGESVGVMVWADETGLRVEWPGINMDVARKVQAKLQEMQKADKPKELNLTRFPVSAASVAKMQEEHPEFATLSIDEIAPKIGVTRLIYIEIKSFQTRPEQANDLFRGSITGAVRVVEVHNGKAQETFADDTLHITYPRTAPEEGLPSIGDTAIYNGTLDGFATEVAKLFLPHGNDPDAPYAAKRDMGVPTVKTAQ